MSLQWPSPASSAGTGTWAARGGLVWCDRVAASGRTLVPVSVACGSCKTSLSSYLSVCLTGNHGFAERLRRGTTDEVPEAGAAVFAHENEWCSLRAHERRAMSEEIWRIG